MYIYLGTDMQNTLLLVQLLVYQSVTKENTLEVQAT